MNSEDSGKMETNINYADYQKGKIIEMVILILEFLLKPCFTH